MWLNILGIVVSLLLEGCTFALSVDRIPQQGGSTGFVATRNTPPTAGYNGKTLKSVRY